VQVHALERALSGGADAARRLTSDTRLAMEGAPPVIGRAAVASALAATGTLAAVPVGGGVSVSGDLAYSFGSLSRDGKPGYYAHLWTRDPQGEWTLAVAIWYDAAG
jgi:hypothetical protein